ncbi:Starch-binding associating with outer membrane [Catalinimonas alkaloidigena]|uniref:Starch-binding associating with outer membrane n=1 Tax=Catalinimonas alkaloidigena TaxID=1075417 RepID=A0A1G9AKG9_9BACT|nr:RagB/SusD family nutrient uptake outer membrane protein [Catalinimonas alkaloidigena]SDK27015.1 Starch-binding associating with outer membrane [Catalinimonas alkaloidigena]
MIPKIKQLVSLTLVFALGGCQVTDLTPANFLPESEAFADASRVEAAVVGVYEAAQQGYYGTTVQRGYPFGAASTEQGDMKGEDMYNDQLFYEITYTNAWTPTTANNNGMWVGLYRLINRCNVVLEGVATAQESGVITAEAANVYRGEVLFLRALSHHELLVHFSRPYTDDPSSPGILYRTFAINDVSKVSDGEAVQRGTVQADYTQLLADLDEAESLLENGSNVFRAQKGAAIALKSRVKLHMGDWPGVIAEYEKLTTLYALTESPDGPFTSDNSSENIFSLENSAASNPGVNGALVSMYGNPELGGRGLVKVSPVIWQADFWLEGDLRRTLLTTEAANGIYTAKYDAYGVYDDPTPLLRYAEVVLNAAEAYARQNELDMAVTLLNQVRDRALPDGAASYTAASLGGTQAGVLEGIWQERRIEFLAEGKRWMDIHRLAGEGLMAGIPEKAQSRSVTSIDFYTGASPITYDHALAYDNPLFIWPLPLDEMLNNPGLTDADQNPGY